MSNQMAGGGGYPGEASAPGAGSSLSAAAPSWPPRGALSSTCGVGSDSGPLRRGSAGSRGVHFSEAHNDGSSPFAAGAAPSGGGQRVDGGGGREGDQGEVWTAAPLSEQLANELALRCPVVSPGQTTSIADVLSDLHQLFKSCASRLVSDGNIQQGEDNLLPVGAYHLGALQQGGEVDVIYIAPQAVRLAELQAAARAELEGMGAQSQKVCDASADGHLDAPGLRFEMSGVAVRVLFTKRLSGIPSPSSAGGVVRDSAGMFAREAGEQLLAAVPDPRLFVMLLRFVRHWAKQRGVYGGFLGFFGGAAWAVACAHVCRANPQLEFSMLTARFFQSMSRWDWKQPLSLQPTTPGLAAAGGALSSVMDVLLPVGEDISASPNVCETTAKLLQKELRRGHKIAQQVELQRAQWCEVCAQPRFFQRHRHFLEFDFMAVSEPVMAKWLEWCSTVLRGLVPLFESMSGTIVTLRPWPEWLEFRDAQWPHARAIFFGLHLERSGDGHPQGARRSFDLREPIVKFLEDISLWPEAERYANQFELLIRHVHLDGLERWLEQRQEGLVVDRTPIVKSNAGSEQPVPTSLADQSGPVAVR